MADYFCKFFKETVKTLEQPQLFVGCRNHNHHGYNPPPQRCQMEKIALFPMMVFLKEILLGKYPGINAVSFIYTSDNQLTLF